MATDTTNTNDTLVFTRQIAGAEDLLFGFGATAQIREGESISITLINASTIPYDSTRSVKQALDELFAAQALATSS